ncbi:hypothetical protein BaRGS_00002771 [Batillaria attramentaria]|uniref:TIR domain-containing protein n=1 Tax=Batillaria attramentaria TaxID=370345 RepID=A0ABD0M3W0_9CAEN
MGNAKRERNLEGLLLWLVKLAVVSVPLITQGVASRSICTRCLCSDESYCQKHECCHGFDTSLLIPLALTVNCSQPDSPYIEDPGLQTATTTDTSGGAPSQCTGFSITNTHFDSCLTALPSPDDLCNFTDTRAIILTGTSLSEFPDLSCLSRLGLLNLRQNRLEYIPRDAFTGLTMLEEVWLDYNVITHIHPNAFDVSLPNLNKFSITHNRLHAIELWPLTLHHPFCKFDFSYNLITEVTNNRNWTIDPALNYGPGWVDLSHNQLFHSPAKFLKRYGLLNPLILWAKFLHWGFDLRNNPFHCDCGFYEIVVWLGKLKTVMWRDYFNITCTSPPVFNGVSVMDLPAERLTCDVTTNCPKAGSWVRQDVRDRKILSTNFVLFENVFDTLFTFVQDCTCTERPHHKDTLVDCAGLGLSDLPDVVPDGNLTLMFANNSLVRVFPRRYLKRALTVDLSNNRIETISRKVPKLLRKAHLLNLRNNTLRHLPYTLQAMSPDAVLLDPTTLTCACDLTWVSEWIQHSSAPHYTHFACTTRDGRLIPLLNATQHDLGCPSREREASAYKLSLSLVLLHNFTGRFKREGICRESASSKSTDAHPHRYDVFLSTASDSDSDTTWVTENLLPIFRRSAVTCYWPVRDCLPGSVEMEEVTKCLQDSASVLVLLSPGYVAKPACLFQFSQAYSRMMVHGQGHLMILDLGTVSRKCIPDPRLRAMLTLRMCYDASRTDHLHTVASKLNGVVSVDLGPAPDNTVGKERV